MASDTTVTPTPKVVIKPTKQEEVVKRPRTKINIAPYNSGRRLYTIASSDSNGEVYLRKEVSTSPSPSSKGPYEEFKYSRLPRINENIGNDYGAESFIPRLDEFLESKPKPKPKLELRNIKPTFKKASPLELIKILTRGLRNTRR